MVPLGQSFAIVMVDVAEESNPINVSKKIKLVVYNFMIFCSVVIAWVMLSDMYAGKVHLRREISIANVVAAAWSLLKSYPWPLPQSCCSSLPAQDNTSKK